MNRFFSLIAFVMAIVGSMIVFALPLLAMRIGASVFQLGLVGTVAALCYTIACIFTGRMADRFHPKRLMLLGGSLYATFMLGSSMPLSYGKY